MANQTVAAGDRDIAKEMFGSVAGNRWVQLICGVISMITCSPVKSARTRCR